MNKSTPAPWKVTSDGISSYRIEDDHHRVIATIIATTKRSPEEKAANARLIALAPVMFSAILQIARAKHFSTQDFRRAADQLDVAEVFDQVEALSGEES
jgi:hypothetical protein